MVSLLVEVHSCGVVWSSTPPHRFAGWHAPSSPTSDFQVEEAGSVSETLSICLDGVMPEVVLVDWKANGPQTHELIAMLTQLGVDRPPFIVYCTLEMDLLDMQKAHAAGAAEILVKPYDRASMIPKLGGIAHAHLFEEPPARGPLRYIAA